MISGNLIDSHKDVFLKVFPELANINEPAEMQSSLKNNKPFGKDRPYFHLSGLMSFQNIYELAMGEPKGGYHPMQCLDCAGEHVAKAMVNLEEVLKGYDGKIFKEKPDHIPLLIGNIAEAEAQTAQLYEDIAQKARQIKLRIRNLDSKELRNAKDDLNALFYKVIARKHNENIKRIESASGVEGDCGCSKKKP